MKLQGKMKIANAPQPEKLPLAILFEDADILVVDKPAG